jgi:hypothetical protein
MGDDRTDTRGDHNEIASTDLFWKHDVQYWRIHLTTGQPAIEVSDKILRTWIKQNKQGSASGKISYRQMSCFARAYYAVKGKSEVIKPGDVVKLENASGRIIEVRVTAVYADGDIEGVPSYWWDYPGDAKPTQWFSRERIDAAKEKQ